jgi:flagella basal body P-ring formation protein FlgA
MVLRCWACALALLGVATWNAEAKVLTFASVQIHLQPKVSVVGPIFSIGEVAQVLGEDETRCERIRKVPVGRAPLPERPLTLNAMMIRVALRRAGINEAEALVEDGESVVTTASQVYEIQNLLPLIRTDILRATGEAPANVKVDPSTSFEKSVLLPSGKVTSNLRPPVSGLYDGSVLYVVDLSVDGRKLKTIPLRVTVRIERPAVVVTHRVERGEKFEDSKLEIQRLTSGVSSDSVTVMSQALGKTAARAIFPGTALRFQDIADPPMIKRGQEVTCRGHKGNVDIEVQVKALEDGKMGCVIRVENTGSQKILKARVVDETTVEAVAGPESGQH